MNGGAWRATLGFGALCLVARASGAVSLGELEVRSPSGAALEARIPVQVGKDESLSGACFSLAARGPAPLRDASLELRRSAHGTSLFVRTRRAVQDGAAFAIAIACPGASASAAPVEYAVRFRPLAAPGLPVVASLGAREGDSLASLARAIFPGDASVRARYVEAIRAENPALAALGDEEPLRVGTKVALPDLHAFAATIAPRAAPARGKAAAPRPMARKASASQPARKTAATRPAPPPRIRPSLEPASVASVRRAESRRSATGFQLRLSAPVLDLSPSKGMDERKRAQLRERLLVLEADDRTAAMLQLRENIRQLEAQVNELKLKLAATPASMPRRPAAPIAAPAKAEAPKAEPAKIEAPKAEAAKIEAPKAEAAKIEASKDARPAEAARSVKANGRAARKPEVIPRAPGEESWSSNALWWMRLLLIPLAGLLGLRYFARRRQSAKAGGLAEEVPGDIATTEPGTHELEPEAPAAASASAAETRRDAATRVPAEDNVELRRRYMEERFPEIANGALMLEDPRSVVKAARLLHDDGAVERAVELLQFGIEQDPDAMQPWLALFAIFRLQGLPGEFAQLARRFAERHGHSDEWRDVRAIGRALDPANPLYEGVEFGATGDGEAEGWLRAPEDHGREALAGELRSRLMAAASVSDADLRPDPTPALRKAEAFSVA